MLEENQGGQTRQIAAQQDRLKRVSEWGHLVFTLAAVLSASLEGRLRGAVSTAAGSLQPLTAGLQCSACMSSLALGPHAL